MFLLSAELCISVTGCNCAQAEACALQELVCAADADKEAVLAYRQALEQALDQPAAAHPVESYGMENMSLAQVCTILLASLQRLASLA